MLAKGMERGQLVVLVFRGPLWHKDVFPSENISKSSLAVMGLKFSITTTTFSYCSMFFIWLFQVALD